MNLPGADRICQNCRHRNQEAARRGHPSPCNLVRWEGSRHVSPRFTAWNVLKPDVPEACEDFEKKEPKL